MADNNFGFKKKSRGDLELVYATHMGNSTNPATGEVLRLQMGWNSMGEPYYIAWDGNEWIPTDEYAIGAKPTRISLGGTKLSLSGTTTGLDSIPTNAKLAQIQVLPSGTGVAWSSNGLLDVSAKVFHATSKGGLINLDGAKELKDFAAVSLAANGYDIGTQSEVYVEFFNVDNHGNFVTYLDQSVAVVVTDFGLSDSWTEDLAAYSFPASNVVQKTSGSTAWDKSLVSKDSWSVGDAPISFKATTGSISTNLGMFGVGANFAQSGTEFPNLDYAWYVQSDAVIHAYESGSSSYSTNISAANRMFQIDLDGTTVTYKLDGSLMYTSTTPLQPNVEYRLQFTLYTVGSTLSNVSFQ